MRPTRGVPVLLALLASGCAGLPNPPGETATDPATLNLQLGTGYASQGRFDVALDKLKKALSYKENFPQAHNAIAVVYEETGQIELAEQHFQRATALDPGFTLARLNYGQFLCTRGKPAEGEAQMVAVAEAPPNGSEEVAYQAYTAAAICALVVPDRQRAEAYLRKALALKAEDANTLYRLAEVNYATGEYLKARAFLQRYHAQAGYNPESLWLGISIEEKLGDTTSLYQQYRSLLVSRFANSDAAQRLKKSP